MPASPATAAAANSIPAAAGGGSGGTNTATRRRRQQWGASAIVVALIIGVNLRTWGSSSALTTSMGSDAHGSFSSHSTAGGGAPPASTEPYVIPWMRTKPPPPLPPEPFKDQSIDARFTRWSGGSVLDAQSVPLKDTGRIPDRLITTWKSKKLGTNAQAFWDNFRSHEPQLEPVVLDDAECSELAKLYPDLKARYDALPLNVMRADICRVLAVYFFGGYYKDLDVDWRKPLSQWVDPTDGIAYGWEDDEHICQWWFAARPGDPCLRNILQQITNLIADTSAIDFNKNVEAVIDITGPGVWTDALQGCPYKPKYNYTLMRTINVHHDYASAKWVGKDGYVSWLEDRKEKAGWKEVWQEYNIHAFWLDQADRYMYPVDPNPQLPAVKIQNATQSSVLLYLYGLNGPQNVFDGSIETAVETGDDPDGGWFSFEFSEPMEIGTLFGPPKDNHLSCLRFFSRHRDVGAWLFVEPMGLELYDGAGNVVHAVLKQGRITPFHTFHFGGMPTEVSKVRIKRRFTGAFTVSEVQVFSDAECKVARRTELLSFSPKPDASVHPIFKWATTLEAPCPGSRAMSVRAGFQYSVCGAFPPKCDFKVLLGHQHRAVLDAFAMAEFARGRCTPDSVGMSRPGLSEVRDGARLGRHHFADWCGLKYSTEDEKAPCHPYNVYRSATNTTDAEHPDLVYLDMTTEEWRTFPSIIRLLDRLEAATVFIPLRLNQETLNSGGLMPNLEALRWNYAVHAFHLNPGEGLFATTDGHAYPTELHISLTRRAERTKPPRPNRL